MHLEDNLDESRVNANEPEEIKRMEEQFPDLTHQEIIQAIQTQGLLKKDILHYLNQRQKDKDPGIEK